MTTEGADAEVNFKFYIHSLDIGAFGVAVMPETFHFSQLAHSDSLSLTEGHRAYNVREPPVLAMCSCIESALRPEICLFSSWAPVSANTDEVF